MFSVSGEICLQGLASPYRELKYIEKTELSTGLMRGILMSQGNIVYRTVILSYIASVSTVYSSKLLNLPSYSKYSISQQHTSFFFTLTVFYKKKVLCESKGILYKLCHFKQSLIVTKDSMFHWARDI